MIKNDLRKLRKARELVNICLEKIREQKKHGIDTHMYVYQVIVSYRSLFYNIFYEDHFRIDSLFTYIFPIDKFNNFSNVLKIISTANGSSSSNNGIIISSSFGLQIQINILEKLLEELSTILKDALKQESYKIFYSWQGELSFKTNRNLIENALENSIKVLSKEYCCPLMLDKDTKGKAGAPEITKTICDKIDTCIAFVADISFVGVDGKSGRKYPNSNVMLELGYAINSVGDENLILVFNVATGKIEELPFDLRGKRILCYECNEADDDDLKKKVKVDLKKSIHDALKLIYKNNFI
ncbi:MAG: hypothetical protein J6O41_03535 [Clostridia bacterium]|nr:hypothetical protein [Clostridia bacterium]